MKLHQSIVESYDLVARFDSPQNFFDTVDPFSSDPDCPCSGDSDHDSNSEQL